MKFKILKIISWISFIFSICMVFVSIIAILYPVVIAVTSVLAIISLFCLFFYPYRDSNNDQFIPKSKSKNESTHWITRPKRYKTTRRFMRSIWISLFCMVFSFALMGILKMHSWYFYIEPLNKELQTFKDVYKEGGKKFEPLPKTFELKK